MSETTIGDFVSLSNQGDAQAVKTAIGAVLQQKVVVELENRKKEVARSFLNKDIKAETDSQEEIENG